ncbi:precorrin-6y C5,15-methyltransferase (decarboxylating) subunit CbiE [Chlorobium phaeovibrioides]|uniref:Precorrin-6y C5,15-methyltransferase (Decarboxylating) subunit CbiE n=1 Tax=Chlorobium phaeovibrioides TaxID=1094 RepID=A0ABW9USL6_CHLPH|nr:precorrin-6y C5,15-methyltransferase (decarboxylating) subunit CbiE [Chlorobium phaeovibrioides]MWV55014.1 precorrin-6y C5,15-methyltransferase (decarboxylating) subunit CbiE [Chlorobium phaeovibrioides]QEQ57080.1 precorrin-6y C5,15-methyltransferase (decarboxylating) subunit CbiE [Chlorobium phaeovibrioides]
MFERRYTLIGLTDSPTPFLDEAAIASIAAHTLFAGGVRHREIVEPMLPPSYRWITVAPPLDAVRSALEEAGEPVLVFASGDPFFYGFGATLQKWFPDASLQCFPAPHSLQLLARLCMIPYQQMRHASLTGRDWQELDSALISGEAFIGVLTDQRKTPAAIARRLLEYGYGHYRMCVGEALGGERESLIKCSLQKAAEREFAMPNCLLLQVEEPAARRFGISDELFDGLPGRPQMITKMPYRMAAIAALELGRACNFWDVGFCTGSVSIESRLQFPHLLVTAFEKRLECEGILEVNSRRFGTPGIVKVMGDFLLQDHRHHCGKDALVDAAFIGGHGDRLEEVFDIIARYLAPGGRIVMNAVQDSSREVFAASAEKLGFALATPLDMSVGSHNPIGVMKAVKPIH